MIKIKQVIVVEGKYDKINFSSDIVANSEKFAQTYTPGGNYNTPTYHGNGW